jgi:disulfide bond formation protein DsbB
MAAVVGTALGFEHIGGYIPCALCLEQRIPYYIGIPVMLLAALSARMGAPAVLTRVLALAGGLLMVYGACLGIYHAGVEWAWWEGPADCGGAIGGTIDAGTLLDDLNAKKPPSCNEAALRVLGLSFAGWNVIASVILAIPSLRIAYSR